MSARVLVAYAASTGFTARHAADVAGEIAEVGGLEVDVKPIAYVDLHRALRRGVPRVVHVTPGPGSAR